MSAEEQRPPESAISTPVADDGLMTSYDKDFGSRRKTSWFALRSGDEMPGRKSTREIHQR